VVIKKIMDRSGMAKQDIEDDIKNKAKALEWMTENKIFDYISIGKVMAEYNADPQRFLAKIGA
jgi:hypothetical protein